MAVSFGLGDDIKKVIDMTGISTLYDATRAYFDWGFRQGGFMRTNTEECTPCQVRQAFLNRIIPYDKSMKVRFLQDYVMKNKEEIFFEAKAGDEVLVDKTHRIYPLLMNLCDAKKIEEVNG